MNTHAIVWLRRDLRLHDQAALYHALKNHESVQLLFIFDKNILSTLPQDDARVEYIYNTLCKLQEQLASHQSSLRVMYDTPYNAFGQLIEENPPQAVYTNHDYEPYALQRDTTIAQFLREKNIPFHTFKDHVIFEKNEIIKDDQKPYTVYTPYSRKWKANMNDFFLKSYPTENYFHHFAHSAYPLPSLSDIGFRVSSITLPDTTNSTQVIQNYHNTRDIPSIQGTTQLGIHLRFGTISIRKLSRYALQHNEKFLNELIWRDFYQSILYHFPHVVDHSFKPAYDHIAWRNAPSDFEAWCQGTTGYPIVDAGMRQLNNTGWMHNRVRMICASFLTKHLLIDWRLGEAYFAQKLIDFDLASNNGGWQWAAGSGVDAAPYFRIFNPHLQTLKFDPEKKYIRQWVNEYDTKEYPAPIVDHAKARERCLNVYKAALQTT